MSDFLTPLTPMLPLISIQFPIYFMFVFVCLKLHRNSLPTQGNRIFFYTGIISIIFITTNSMLAWLGFGLGKPFADWQNTVLCSFWAGGLSIFLVQIFVWIEVAVRKRTDQ